MDNCIIKKDALKNASFYFNEYITYFTEFTTASKASGLFIARSARALRFRAIPFSLILPMNSEYDMPCCLTPALIRVIHKDLKSLFFARLWA